MSRPTLSQVLVWPAGHLETAEARWTTIAQTWDESFTAVCRQAPTPGGSPWEGLTADAAIQQVGADRRRVLGAVDRLHTAAVFARSGAAEINGARQQALQAVTQARAAGFTVGEDLSVTDAGTTPLPARAARMAQARQLAAKIQDRAAALVTVDREVAAKITAATSGLTAVEFGEGPVSLLRGSPVPLGPVVWCLQPGTSGKWRCSVLYADGTVDGYWSFHDDSGGF